MLLLWVTAIVTGWMSFVQVGRKNLGLQICNPFEDFSCLYTLPQHPSTKPPSLRSTAFVKPSRNYDFHAPNVTVTVQHPFDASEMIYDSQASTTIIVDDEGPYVELFNDTNANLYWIVEDATSREQQDIQRRADEKLHSSRQSPIKQNNKIIASKEKTPDALDWTFLSLITPLNNILSIVLKFVTVCVICTHWFATAFLPQWLDLQAVSTPAILDEQTQIAELPPILETIDHATQTNYEQDGLNAFQERFIVYALHQSARRLQRDLLQKWRIATLSTQVLAASSRESENIRHCDELKLSNTDVINAKERQDKEMQGLQRELESAKKAMDHLEKTRLKGALEKNEKLKAAMQNKTADCKAMSEQLNAERKSVGPLRRHNTRDQAVIEGLNESIQYKDCEFNELKENNAQQIKSLKAGKDAAEEGKRQVQVDRDRITAELELERNNSEKESRARNKLKELQAEKAATEGDGSQAIRQNQTLIAQVKLQKAISESSTTEVERLKHDNVKKSDGLCQKDKALAAKGEALGFAHAALGRQTEDLKFYQKQTAEMDLFKRSLRKAELAQLSGKNVIVDESKVGVDEAEIEADKTKVEQQKKKTRRGLTAKQKEERERRRLAYESLPRDPEGPEAESEVVVGESQPCIKRPSMDERRPAADASAQQSLANPIYDPQVQTRNEDVLFENERKFVRWLANESEATPTTSTSTYNLAPPLSNEDTLSPRAPSETLEAGAPEIEGTFEPEEGDDQSDLGSEQGEMHLGGQDDLHQPEEQPIKKKRTHRGSRGVKRRKADFGRAQEAAPRHKSDTLQAIQPAQVHSDNATDKAHPASSSKLPRAIPQTSGSEHAPSGAMEAPTNPLETGNLATHIASRPSPSIRVFWYVESAIPARTEPRVVIGTAQPASS
ncbi:MAG: hypothetical protein Q9164_002053 [Protoblastenia rupestris]